MGSGHRDQPERDADWIRSERRSFWIALVIALGPIPVALLISWVFGAPPWRPYPEPETEQPWHAREHPGKTGHDSGPPGHP
ncbi:hypothetical protein P12x_002838 [Tundrisphaera lichenicola]|uniref:hypothetical protein n=1 Tax=Tundrisphaera lichenicola TaxID=2029860 RepID=UPI003EBB4153